MDRINQTLLTIIEANRLATAKNPHAHRLALILLDNLIEIQLRQKASSEFGFDRTNWITGVRKYNKKRRGQVNRYHAPLLELAIEKSWITEIDAKILAFAHRLRNTTYHEGTSDDPLELEIGLTLLFRFVTHYLPKWRCSGWIRISPQKPIQIDKAIEDPSGFAPLVIPAELEVYEPLSHGSYDENGWQRKLDYCTTFDYQRDIRPVLKKRIDNMLNNISEHIYFLTKYDDTDFNAVMAHRFSRLTPFFSDNEIAGKKISNPVAALNIYLAVLDHEEELLDLADATERTTRFHELLNKHEFDRHLLKNLDLQNYYSRAESTLKKPEHEGIAIFLEAEHELKHIANAAYECALDLDGYTMFMVDYLRGR
jgi:hypothetical protein